MPFPIEEPSVVSRKFAMHKRNFQWVLLCLALFAISACGGGGGGSDPVENSYQPAQSAKTLNIEPIAQQTEVWCWAAATEMIFKHYSLPNINPGGNYQCGIVAAYYGSNSSCWFDCFSCISAIGPMSNAKNLIDGYGVVARNFTNSRVLTSSLIFSPLPFNEVAREIDSLRPIVAGISPQGYAYPNISEHIVAIVGYQIMDGVELVVVNDPFPYDLFPLSPNPYVIAGAARSRPGQYIISYPEFIGRLRWANTIYNIR
jgi:Peptidase_C39 like family